MKNSEKIFRGKTGENLGETLFTQFEQKKKSSPFRLNWRILKGIPGPTLGMRESETH
jgi:hypothetical protein